MDNKHESWETNTAGTNIGCAVTVNNSTEVVDMKLVFTEGYPVMFETRCRWHLIIMIHSDAHG